MRIPIDGVDYYVSMTWHQDNTITHYVWIGGKYYKLDIESEIFLDGMKRENVHDFRERLATEIKKILDNFASNRWT